MATIKEKTTEIIERCEALMAKAFGCSGTGALASLGDNEVVMLRDAMKLIEDSYELMTMQAEALDKIEKIEKSNEKIMDMLTELKETKQKCTKKGDEA